MAPRKAGVAPRGPVHRAVPKGKPAGNHCKAEIATVPSAPIAIAGSLAPVGITSGEFEKTWAPGVVAETARAAFESRAADMMQAFFVSWVSLRNISISYRV